MTRPWSWTRSARSNGRRTHFGECERPPSAIAAKTCVQGLRQVVRAGGRRIRPVHVQALPEGKTIRHIRLPRVRRGRGARAAGGEGGRGKGRKGDRHEQRAPVRPPGHEECGVTPPRIFPPPHLSSSGCFLPQL